MVTAIETRTRSPVTVIEAMAMNDAYITAIDADIIAQGAPGERDHRRHHRGDRGEAHGAAGELEPPRLNISIAPPVNPAVLALCSSLDAEAVLESGGELLSPCVNHSSHCGGLISSPEECQRHLTFERWRPLPRR